MGVLGKLIVFALVVPAWLNGEVTLLGASAAMVDFIFTLDTTAPGPPTFDLAPASDTQPLGDKQTEVEIVTLVGGG